MISLENVWVALYVKEIFAHLGHRDCDYILSFSVLDSLFCAGMHSVTIIIIITIF